MKLRDRGGPSVRESKPSHFNLVCAHLPLGATEYTSDPRLNIAEGPSVGGKRKRGKATDDERDSVPSDDQDSPNESEPDDSEEFISKSAKTRTNSRPTKKVASGKGTTAARKTTGPTQPTAGAATKTKTTAPRRARKVADAAEAAAGGAELGKDLHLASDNPLFSGCFLVT